MAQIELRDVTKRYDDGFEAVKHMNIDIGDGEFMILVGPSGCGKSTALRMIAGLEDVSAGTIAIDGRVVNRVPPKDRDIAMVFQNYALYPHMTVAENMGFALKIAKVDKATIAKRVEEAAKLLELTEYLGRKPKALSGGQRQRVAMGRAIVREPKVFLMDEPLSNLDAKLRVQTRTQIASLQRRLGITTVYVTHDQVEAMTMGDRVAVLKDGLLQQCDTPRAMYEKPANVFVAGFIGSPAMNLVEVPIVEDGVKFDGLTIPVSRDALGVASGGGAKTLTVGVRPESFDFVGDADGAIAVTVHLVEELGADAFAYCAARVGENDVDLIVRVDARAVPMKGDTLYVKPRASETHLFSASSGERIEA